MSYIHINYITLTQLPLPEIMSITTNTLDTILYIIMYYFTWVTVTCIFLSPLHGYSIILNTIISCTCSTVTQRYYRTRHCHFMYTYHRYTNTITLDTIISCSCTTDTGIHYSIGYCYFIYLYHRYTNTLYTVISCPYNTVTWIHL